MTSDAAQYHQDLQTALDRLAQARSGDVRKHRDEFGELPNILEFGELPRELISRVQYKGDGVNLVGAMLVGTNRRVILVNKARRGAMEVIDFPYDQISSVESNTGRLLGEINLDISGTRHRIHNIVNQEVNDLAAFIQRALQAARDRMADPEQPAEPGSGAATGEAAQYHEDLEAALARLSQERSGDVGKHRDEFRELPNILQFGELPGDLVARVTYSDAGYAFIGAMLVGTNRRVILVGQDSGRPIEVIDFPYDQITSAESKTGMMFGEINLDMSGTVHRIHNMEKGEVNRFAAFLQQAMQAAWDRIAEPEEPEEQAEPAEPVNVAEQYGGAVADVLIPWELDEKWSSWVEEIKLLAGVFMHRDKMELWELPEQLVEARFGPSGDSEALLLVRTNFRFVCLYRQDGSYEYVEFPYDELSSITYGTDSNFGVLTLDTGEHTIAFYMDQEEAREYADYARGRMQAARDRVAEPVQPRESPLPEQSGQPAAPVNGALTAEQEQYAYALKFIVEREAGHEYWSKWTEWTEVIRSLPRLIDWTTWEFPTDVDEARDGPSEDAAELLFVRTNLRLVFLFRVEDGSLQYVEFPYDQISSIVARPVANQGQLTLETDDNRFVFYMDDDEVDEVANEVREQMQAAKDGAVGPAELERKQFVHALVRVSFGLLERDEEVSSKWENEEVMEALVALDEDQWEMPVQFAEARFRPSDDSAVLLLFRTNLRLVFLYRVEDGSAQFSGCSYDDISSIEAGTHANYGELTLESGGETFVFYMDQGEARDFADYARAKMQVATAGTAAPAPQAPAEPASPEAPAPPTATQAASVADELERLADLRARGLLTDEEFTLAKERLLQ